MASPTVKIVADVSPTVADLLAAVARKHNVSKRAVLEIAIELLASTLGVEAASTKGVGKA